MPPNVRVFVAAGAPVCWTGEWHMCGWFQEADYSYAPLAGGQEGRCQLRLLATGFDSYPKPNPILQSSIDAVKKSFPLFFYSKSSKHDRNRRSRRRFSAFRWRSVEICALPRADVFSGENRELKSDWRYYLKCLIPKKDIRKVNQFSFEFCFSNAETQR